MPRKITKIILHRLNLESPKIRLANTLEGAKQYFHVQLKYRTPAYHYFVGDSAVTPWRDLDKMGAHTYGQNSNSIGIAFWGDFRTQGMPTNQAITGSWLLASLCIGYNLNPKDDLFLHSDFSDKKCPGENFPLDLIKEMTTNLVKVDFASGPSIPRLLNRW